MDAATADACFVLIVDDEEGVRESLRDVVEMVGCVAQMAEDGEDALAILATRRPCLVIVDLLMPRMNGAELVDAIRAKPALAGVQIVMSTSAPERAPRGVPILAKPIDVDALCVWIRRVCRCVGTPKLH